MCEDEYSPLNMCEHNFNLRMLLHNHVCFLKLIYVSALKSFEQNCNSASLWTKTSYTVQRRLQEYIMYDAYNILTHSTHRPVKMTRSMFIINGICWLCAATLFKKKDVSRCNTVMRKNIFWHNVCISCDVDCWYSTLLCVNGAGVIILTWRSVTAHSHTSGSLTLFHIIEHGPIIKGLHRCVFSGDRGKHATTVCFGVFLCFMTQTLMPKINNDIKFSTFNMHWNRNT